MRPRGQRISKVYDDSSDDSDHSSYSSGRGGTQTRVLSKNAINARQNRLRKKLHLASLEEDVQKLKRDNSHFKNIIDDRDRQIKEQQNYISYLKTVIRRTPDIKKLVRNIVSTGNMSVINADETLSLNSNCVSKPASLAWETLHSPSPSPESEGIASSLYDCEAVDFFSSTVFGSKEFDLQPPLFNDILMSPKASPDAYLEEHNYTFPVENIFKEEDEEDERIGICLHVMDNREMTLEFCPTCHDSAKSARMNQNGDCSRRLPKYREVCLFLKPKSAS